VAELVLAPGVEVVVVAPEVEVVRAGEVAQVVDQEAVPAPA
jgi:hypothetical protein